MKTKNSPLLIAGLSLLAFQYIGYAGPIEDYNSMVGSTPCVANTSDTCAPGTAPNPPIYYKVTNNVSKILGAPSIIFEDAMPVSIGNQTQAQLRGLLTADGYTWAEGDRNFPTGGIKFYDSGCALTVKFPDFNGKITFKGVEGYFIIFDSTETAKGTTITFTATQTWDPDNPVTCSITLSPKRATRKVGCHAITTGTTTKCEYINGRVFMLDIKISRTP